MVTEGGEKEESGPLPDLMSTNAKYDSVDGAVHSSTLAEQQERDYQKVLGQIVLFNTRSVSVVCP